MSDPPVPPSHKAAIQAIRSGDKALARRILAELLAEDPEDERAWLLLAGCVSEAHQKRDCLQMALRINPQNGHARNALVRLDAMAGPSAQGEMPKASKSQGKPRQKSHQGERQPKSAGFTRSQIILLLLLSLIILGALGGMGFLSLQIGGSSIPSISQNPGQTEPGQPAVAPPVLALPQTWTPLPSPTAVTPSASPPHPTFTPFATPTPVVSLTPSSKHWRIVIGYSVQNRPIEVYRFGTGRVERMVVAGIHGAYERNTTALADELVEHLGENPELVPPEVTLYILRSLNPDGEARDDPADGRSNANGVDLNRNWSVNWAENWSRTGCWSLRPTTAGSGPNSEPETKALEKFLLSRNVDALISYHSAALGIFPGGEPGDPRSERLAQAIAAISDYPYPPVDTGCEYSGTLPDWGVSQGIAAVDLELSDHTSTDFQTNLEVLDLLVNWAL